MTFKEFFNQRDNSPIKLGLKRPSQLTGMEVVHDFSKADTPSPALKPTPPTPIRPPKPVTLMGRSRLGDRPIEKKPSDFLPRASSPLPNNK